MHPCCLGVLVYTKRLLIAPYSVHGGGMEIAGYGKRLMNHSSSVGNVITGWPTGKSYRSLLNKVSYGVTLLRLTWVHNTLGPEVVTQRHVKGSGEWNSKIKQTKLIFIRKIATCKHKYEPSCLCSVKSIPPPHKHPTSWSWNNVVHRLTYEKGGRSGLQIPAHERKFSPKCRNQLWCPSSLFNGYRSLFSHGVSSRSVRLTTHLHLVLR